MSLITLKCVKENNKLRIKITSPGFASQANCQFPKNIRIENQEYTVPQQDITMSDTKGKFYYRVKKNNIKLIDKLDLTKLVVYNQDLTECGICLDNYDEYVIFVPCGHMISCKFCAAHLKQCCLCRADIKQVITKDQLQ